MSEFEVDRDNDYEWVSVGWNVLFAEDCAATMNQMQRENKALQCRLCGFVSE